MKRITLILTLTILHVFAFSQVNITSLATPYTQDFNTLANTSTSSTLPTGWLLLETGTSANTTYSADNGASNAGNTYSYGTTGATERAFGTVQSGSVIPTIGVYFTNHSGGAITSIAVNYTGEQWRAGLANRTAPDSLEFQYSTDATSLSTGTWTNVTALNFASPTLNVAAGALDGNAAANRTAINFTITNLNIADGATFYFRWNDYNIASSDDGLAIDDVTITFNGNAAPGCTEPSAQPTNLVLTPTPTTIAGTFTASAADQFMVVQSNSATAPTPVDGTAYNVGSTAFGAGTLVVSNGTNTNFTATGLTPNQQYYFYVFSLNDENCTGGPNYLNTAPLSGNATTLPLPACVAPTAPPTNLVLTSTNTTINGTFTASATANRYLTVISTTSSLSATPVNGTTYTAGSNFGGGKIVSYSSAISFNATGLTINTPYFIFVFAASGDCNGEPFYNTTSLNGTKSTTNNTGGIPTGYYDAATGLSCQPLKTALKNIIKTDFQVLGYTPGIWNIFKYSDQHRNDANTADIIWDMYSDNPTGPEPYTYTYGTNQCGNYNSEGDCYNREHSTPQSWFNSQPPMVSDAHHLFPTDGKVNGVRNNYPYGNVSSATFTSLNGSKLGTGNNFGYTGIVFEPIDAYKGDFARACLYMATRYEDEIISQNWSANGNGNDVLLSATDQIDAALRRLMIYDPWYLQTLIKWHLQDPPSQKEIDRNNAIYSQAVVVDGSGTLKAQSNRNPFVDHPEYVAMIWGDGTVGSLNCSTTTPCTAPTAQPTALILTPSTTSIAGSFTAASPAPSSYLVVRSTNNSLSANPVNATTYTAGQSLGGGTVVQYSSSTTFTDASLTASTTYYYFIFSANNTSCTGGPVYFTTGPLTGNSTTTAGTPACTAPTAQPTTLVLTPSTTSIAGSFTAASPAPSSYLVVRSTNNSLSANPVNATTYTTGQALGGGTVVQYSNSTTFNDASLTSSTTYYYFIFSANNTACTGGPVYLTTVPLTGNSTTTAVTTPCTAPTAQATNLVLTPLTTSIAGSFTAASPAPSSYLVIRSTSNSLSALPSNTNTYTAGQAIGGGTVVQYSNSTTFNDVSLTSSTTYHYFIFSANNTSCVGGPVYLTTNPLTGNATTAVVIGACTTPVAVASNLVLTKSGNAINGTFTGVANGSYLVLMTNYPNLTNLPVNGVTYTPGQLFGNAKVISFGSSTSFTANNILAGKDYYFFVFTSNTNCTGSPFYNTTNFISVSANPIKRDNVYPNPAKDMVTLELATPPSQDLTLTITDMLSQKVQTQLIKAGQQVTTINISKLAPGKYFITVYDYGTRLIKSFVKK